MSGVFVFFLGFSWLHWVFVSACGWCTGLVAPVACGILVPWPGIEPTSPALESEFLNTGPPGKSSVSQAGHTGLSVSVHLTSCLAGWWSVWGQAPQGCGCNLSTVLSVGMNLLHSFRSLGRITVCSPFAASFMVIGSEFLLVPVLEGLSKGMDYWESVCVEGGWKNARNTGS